MKKTEKQIIDQRIKKIRAEQAQRTRQYKRERFLKVIDKESVETYEDTYNILLGLPRKSIENAAYYYLCYLAKLGYSPKEIVSLLKK